MSNAASVTSKVTIRGHSWTSTQHRDIIEAAGAVLDRNPGARVNNLAVRVSPQGRRSTMTFTLEETIRR